jgi:hypothetical protein
LYSAVSNAQKHKNALHPAFGGQAYWHKVAAGTALAAFITAAIFYGTATDRHGYVAGYSHYSTIPAKVNTVTSISPS